MTSTLEPVDMQTVAREGLPQHSLPPPACMQTNAYLQGSHII
jgi:hypothetical protein